MKPSSISTSNSSGTPLPLHSTHFALEEKRSRETEQKANLLQHTDGQVFVVHSAFEGDDNSLPVPSLIKTDHNTVDVSLPVLDVKSLQDYSPSSLSPQSDHT